MSSGCLEPEFEAGVLMHDRLHIGESPKSLSKPGVRIASDDFGTGFSSLSYLRNYPIDAVKMDRSFIADVDRNSRSLALNDAAISMAHALGISVVAEGVESWSRFDALQPLQCDFAQGYHFGKPMPPEQLSRMRQLQKTRGELRVGDRPQRSPAGFDETNPAAVSERASERRCTGLVTAGSAGFELGDQRR